MIQVFYQDVPIFSCSVPTFFSCFTCGICLISQLYMIFFYFISIFILLTCRKATEVLINRARNYPNLLLEMPRYCSLLGIFYFCYLFLLLKLELLPKTAKQGTVLSSVFSKDTIEWHKQVLNQDHVNHNHGALTTQPCCRQICWLDNF